VGPLISFPKSHNYPTKRLLAFSQPTAHRSFYTSNNYFFKSHSSTKHTLSAHLVPEQHRVIQVTSEFKDFAIIWWTGLIAECAAPSTWDELKAAMRDRFVSPPPSYHRDLCKKPMRLEHGDKSV